MSTLKLNSYYVRFAWDFSGCSARIIGYHVYCADDNKAVSDKTNKLGFWRLTVLAVGQKLADSDNDRALKLLQYQEILIARD